jgi:aromatic ring-opening dioxygenase LigB subunit
VLVSPARDLPAEVHVAAGRVIAETAAASGKRVAVIASADHGHAHDLTGPYGFDPASAVYDEEIVGLVRENRLAGLLSYEAPTYFGMLGASFTPKAS